MQDFKNLQAKTDVVNISCCSLYNKLGPCGLPALRAFDTYGANKSRPILKKGQKYVSAICRLLFYNRKITAGSLAIFCQFKRGLLWLIKSRESVFRIF